MQCPLRIRGAGRGPCPVTPQGREAGPRLHVTTLSTHLCPQSWTPQSRGNGSALCRPRRLARPLPPQPRSVHCLAQQSRGRGRGGCLPPNLELETGISVPKVGPPPWEGPDTASRPVLPLFAIHQLHWVKTSFPAQISVQRIEVLPKFLGIFGFQVLGQPTPSPASDLVVGPILSMQKSIQPLLWVIGCPENGFVGLSFGGRAVHHKPTSIVVHTARTPHSTLLAPCTPRARHSSWPRRQPPAPPPPLRCRPAASRHGLRPRAWPHRHPGPCPTHHGVSLWRSRMHVPSFPIGEVIVGSTRWGAFYPQPSIIRDSCPQYGGCCGVVQPVCKSSARAASNMAPAGGTPRPRPLTPAAPAPAPAPQRCHPAGGETHRIRPPAANPGNGPQRSSNCGW